MTDRNSMSTENPLIIRAGRRSRIVPGVLAPGCPDCGKANHHATFYCAACRTLQDRVCTSVCRQVDACPTCDGTGIVDARQNRVTGELDGERCDSCGGEGC